MRIPSKLAGAVLAAAAVTLLPAAASAHTDVRAAGTLKVVDTITQKRINSAADKSGLDVYLPDTLATGSTKPSKIKGSSIVSKGNYTLDLGVGSRCGGATACFVAEFTGIAGEKPHYSKKIKLRGGKTIFALKVRHQGRLREGDPLTFALDHHNKPRRRCQAANHTRVEL